MNVVQAPRCALFILVLLALATSALLPAATADEHEPMLLSPRATLVLVGEEPGRTTVFQYHYTQAPDGDPVAGIAVPRHAEQREVTDGEGESVIWAELRSGVLTIEELPAGGIVHIASRGLKGPAPGAPLEFGPDPYEAPTMFVVALPASRSESVVGLTPIDRDELLGIGLFPPHWPLPADARLYWNEARLEALPARIELTAGAGEGIIPPYAVAAGIGLLLAALTVWLVMRIHATVDDPTRPRSQPIMSHLDELRRRFAAIFVVLAAAMTFFFAFGFRWVSLAGVPLPLPWPSLYGNAAAQVFGWLSTRIVPAGVEIVVVSPWDAVITLLLLSIAMASVATFPVLFYHTYAFLAPALYPRERRLVLSLVPVVVILLILGAGFGIAVMAPLIVRVLYGFAIGVGATALVTMSQLVGIAALMGVVFAISFQLPLVMMATARMGLVSAATYRKKWRHAVIVIAIAAALVTDPTILTQIIVGLVLLALYGIGVLLATLVDRERGSPRD